MLPAPRQAEAVGLLPALPSKASVDQQYYFHVFYAASSLILGTSKSLEWTPWAERSSSPPCATTRAAMAV